MTICIILGITLSIIILVISLTFLFLIKANKIKPSKVSRIFYIDDESFIKSWEKAKEKGRLMYDIKSFIMYTVFNGILVLIILTKDNNSVMYVREHILSLLILISVFSLLSTLIRWGIGQDRYSKLKEKVKNINTRNIKE